MPAAYDIYTEQLSQLQRGHALYYPEPRADQGPIEIGDVGYIKHGAFHRLFNISRAEDDPCQRFGVPSNFERLDMGLIGTYEAALEPGPLHSKTVYTLAADVGASGVILPAEASFQFKCSSKRGAILMLETQMKHQEAIQNRRFETYLQKHYNSWHEFTELIDIRIGFGDLMLVTECSKTAAWSSMVYSNSASEFSLGFSVGVPFATGVGPGAAASASIERMGPIERRRSQHRALSSDPASAPQLPYDHTVFIKAYRLGVRKMYYQSLVHIFFKAISSPNEQSNTGARIAQSNTSVGGSSQSAFPPSASSSSAPSDEPPRYSKTPVIPDYQPDFHPAAALLGRALEENSQMDCAIIHDNAWCSGSLESDDARAIEEYLAFYFMVDYSGYKETIPQDDKISKHSGEDELTELRRQLGKHRRKFDAISQQSKSQSKPTKGKSKASSSQNPKRRSSISLDSPDGYLSSEETGAQ